MLYIIVGILIFGALIAVHEFGHFITAKLFGVRVNEFAIGMGPAIFHRQRGETEYSLRLFPVGGYCAMEGEDDDSDDPRAFGSAKLWKKLIVLCAGAWMRPAGGGRGPVCGRTAGEQAGADQGVPQSGGRYGGPGGPPGWAGDRANGISAHPDQDG